MNLQTTNVRSRRHVSVLTGFALYLVIALPAVMQGGSDQPRLTAEDTEFTRLFELCVNGDGLGYAAARKELLALGSDLLRPKWEVLQEGDGGRTEKLMAAILLRWSENASECEDYHGGFNNWIKSSFGTVSGKPSVKSITGFCLRDSAAGHDHELLMLERLLKYDDPPHVKHGIIRALGAVGTEESLEPLLGLLRSDRPGMPIGRCAAAIGGISMRIGDTRAVDDIVTQYRVRPRRRGTGLPEEQLRLMPPFPQVQFISALSQIGGEKVVKALEELLAEETDPPLISRLRDTHAKVKERMLKERNQESATPDPQD